MMSHDGHQRYNLQRYNLDQVLLCSSERMLIIKQSLFFSFLLLFLFFKSIIIVFFYEVNLTHGFYDSFGLVLW